VRALIARLIIMFAVLVMPFGMTPAAATAHSMHDDIAMHAGMAMQHCPDPAPSHDKGAMAACTMACASALPAADPVRAEPPVLRDAPLAAVVERGLEGLHPETETPPPKLG
jgi:hypothetical protein